MKAPYPFTTWDRIKGNPYNPGVIHSREDVFGMPQLSGSALKYLRDWAVFQGSRYLKHLHVSASGGVDSAEDVNVCLSLGATTVQLGTAALIDMNRIQSILNESVQQYDRPMVNLPSKNKRFVRRKAELVKGECEMCGRCLRTAYCDAFRNRFHREYRESVLSNLDEAAVGEITIPPTKMMPDIDELLCLGCGLCAQVCTKGAIRMVAADGNGNG